MICKNLSKTETTIFGQTDPFPHTKASATEKKLKTLWQMEKWLMMSNFSICKIFSTIFKGYSLIYKSLSISLLICFQSHLLQICCMWEWVVYYHLYFNKTNNKICKYHTPLQEDWSRSIVSSYTLIHANNINLCMKVSIRLILHSYTFRHVNNINLQICWMWE